MRRQWIWPKTIAQLDDLPGVSIAHDLGHAVWVQVREDGGINLGESAHWSLYRASDLDYVARRLLPWPRQLGEPSRSLLTAEERRRLWGAADEHMRAQAPDVEPPAWDGS